MSTPTLLSYQCGMTAPEFSYNHTHDLECISPATPAEILAAARQLVKDGLTCGVCQARFPFADFVDLSLPEEPDE